LLDGFSKTSEIANYMKNRPVGAEFLADGRTDRHKGKGKVIPLQARLAQRVGRGIAVLFHDRDTRRG